MKMVYVIIVWILLNQLEKNWFPNDEGRKKLSAIIKKIKSESVGQEYSCIMGLSGGVDSSYLAYVLVKEFGLRPLVVHVDGGWNSEQATSNIEVICKKLDLDLFTFVVDWAEMADVQLAFLRAGLANQDVPQDHAFFARLTEVAVEKGIKYVISGSNIATESVLPRAWGYTAMDCRHLTSVHKKFGSKKIKNFPRVGFLDDIFIYPISGVKTIKPLNFLEYDKDKAINVLQNELGWSYYGGKHHESKFTKFFQTYYLPEKFGFDKRRAHYSSLILSKYMRREEALKLLERMPYNNNEIAEEKDYIARKLNISIGELNSILDGPIKTYKDYGNSEALFNFASRVKKTFGKVL